jgi:hypothetical protein
MDIAELSMMLETLEVQTATEEEFQAAVEKVKAIANVVPEQQIILYGLFKQCTVGDVSVPSPDEADVVAKHKWCVPLPQPPILTYAHACTRAFVLVHDTHYTIPCIFPQGHVEGLPGIPYQQRTASVRVHRGPAAEHRRWARFKRLWVDSQYAPVSVSDACRRLTWGRCNPRKHCESLRITLTHSYTLLHTLTHSYTLSCPLTHPLC